MSNENRQKKSWREIDRARESGSSATRSAEPRRDVNEDRQQKQYRAALEALFNGGGLGKLADKLAPLPLRPLPGQSATSPSVPAPGEVPEVVAEVLGLRDERPEPEAPARAVAPSEPAAAPAAPTKGGKKKPTEDKATLRRKVLESAGRHEISRAIERYLERFPLPEDHEFLEQLLEHEKEARIVEGMTRIAALLDQGITPRRSRALCSKLRYLQDTSGDVELRDQARALLQRLGG